MKENKKCNIPLAATGTGMGRYSHITDIVEAMESAESKEIQSSELGNLRRK